MKLDYHILWFEDQPRDIEGQKNTIEDYLEQKGFRLKVTNEKNGNAIDKLIDPEIFNEYDLVLMDWKLGAQSNSGDKLAKIIRNKFKTEIIFYSAEDPGKLRELILGEKIDGVFCSHRDELGHEAMGVIEIAIRRFQHPNAMRGLFMAETSDFDEKMLQCIKNYLNTHGKGKTAELLKEILQTVESMSGSSIKQFKKKLEQGKTEDFLGHREFSASQKLSSLINLLAAVDAPELDTCKLKLGKYKEEIQDPRNALAHVKMETRDGKPVLVGRDIEFNQESLIGLRKKLLEHGENLDDLIDHLKPAQD